MKESAKAFRKLFPKTDEGYARFIDGYLYGAYPKLYIYHLKSALNRLKPVPDKLQFPEGERYRIVDDFVKATVDNLNPKLITRETSPYHGKVLRVDDAKKILSLNVDVNMPNLPETILPYEKVKDLIIQGPDQICVVDCACRSTREGGCYPRDVCMIIGEPFVSFVMDHNMDNPRKITQEEAIAIIEAEYERGHVSTAYFKDSQADRFYAICNCCDCCCNAMAAFKLGAPIFVSSGYVREVSDNCQGCGSCVEMCPFDALSLVDEKAVVDADKCMGCGRCEAVCVNNAVIIKPDPSKGEPLDMDVLLAQS